MRKELTAISALSMAISFMASVILCLQLAQNKLVLSWQPDGLTLWSLEIAIFGLAFFLWRREVSLVGWALGIGMLLLIRFSISTTAAFGLSFSQGIFVFEEALVPLSTLLPRICAVFFALMVGYPLCVFLPGRSLRRKHASPRKSEAQDLEEDVSTWLVGNNESVSISLSSRKNEWQPFMVKALEAHFEGSIELPLRVVLTNVPAEHLAEDANDYDDDFPVSLPLSLIGPQLKEARILLQLDDLYKLLPPGVLSRSESPDVEDEPVLVTLALEEVVPRLPSQALELPPPSPPLWVKFPDPENVVFAAV